MSWFLIQTPLAYTIVTRYLSENFDVSTHLFPDIRNNIYRPLQPPYFISLDICNRAGYEVVDQLFVLLNILATQVSAPFRLTLPAQMSNLFLPIADRCFPFLVPVIPNQMHVLLYNSKSYPELLDADETTPIAETICTGLETLRYSCCGCCGTTGNSVVLTPFGQDRPAVCPPPKPKPISDSCAKKTCTVPKKPICPKAKPKGWGRSSIPCPKTHPPRQPLISNLSQFFFRTIWIQMSFVAALLFLFVYWSWQPTRIGQEWSF